MSEKSGLEMLEEILSRLEDLEKRITIIDTTVKAIANSANLANMVSKLSGTKLDGWAKATKPGLPEAPNVAEKIEKIQEKSGFKNFKFEPSDASKVSTGSALADKTARGAGLKKIMVKGRLKVSKNGESVPLASASVTIYDAKDQEVKKTKTNRAGLWMSQLSPGKYVALFEGELDGKKLLPQNINFEVPTSLPEGQTEFEVL